MVYGLRVIHPREANNINVQDALDEMEIDYRKPAETIAPYSRNSQMNSVVYILPDTDKNKDRLRNQIRSKLDEMFGVVNDGDDHRSTVVEIMERDSLN